MHEAAIDPDNRAMMSFNQLIAIALGVFRFVVLLSPFAADGGPHARAGRLASLPIVYTLSLSIYCTAWTFYGADRITQRDSGRRIRDDLPWPDPCGASAGSDFAGDWCGIGPGCSAITGPSPT